MLIDVAPICSRYLITFPFILSSTVFTAATAKRGSTIYRAVAIIGHQGRSILNGHYVDYVRRG